MNSGFHSRFFNLQEASNGSYAILLLKVLKLQRRFQVTGMNFKGCGSVVVDSLLIVTPIV